MEEPTKDKLMQEAFKDMKERQAVMQNINAEPTPETPIDVAHLLIQNSNITNYMPEVDKELKLANLDNIEKYQVNLYATLYQDITWLRREQKKKNIEFENRFKHKLQNQEIADIYNDEYIVEVVEEELDKLDPTSTTFDKAGLLRGSLYIPALTRGKFGFERTKQVETISRSSIETNDNTEKKPGFLGGFFKGGFKR